MGHAQIDNATPYACSHFFARDEEGRWLAVVLVQATFTITSATTLALAPEQPPPDLAGKLWGADAAVSSYRSEPAFAFVKVATDLVLVGHAHARQLVPELQVGFRVGSVGKSVRVIGDRSWLRSGSTILATRPRPFDRMPLVYERAYGGWDRSNADSSLHVCDLRNPVGVGFRSPDAVFEDALRLPNLEDPRDPLLRYGQAIVPVGVGFTSPHWQPRVGLAGAFDAAWMTERTPLLPKGFDRRFFSGASAGLVAPGFIAGDELVTVESASPLGTLSFRLPGIRPPRCRAAVRGREDAEIGLMLDTLVVDTDTDRVTLLYRGHAPLRDGPHDVVTLALS